MKKKVKIGTYSPYPLYIPKDLAKEGFVGETWLFANAKTVTIVHPRASLEEIEESLEIVLQDIRLRKKSEMR
ncbi:MAG: hypothetical protein JSV56_03820 [Methanomassiliicoccales archaeon]|nr:MAG: hypothetical protein JSV56_03820 [Methanomassiliicoccales archaeon]